ncbi:phosphoglucomutase/phosphomannomutase family protein [Carboxydothermus ferrireducens]|uniref:Phosphoglucomutase n=1 Tax=Carboxydothermus ferrireducens DSM 11255 TaxID=1119529 RepID=A0ABX2RCT1_9THEO|nr:phosphoglucomutase/phosphomannomutase family protein [Carboxydothermus ferrireducens]NYE57685.1 phosphomannomutase [Carboxydothermus ferrireducens DSM 11255]
MIKFGTDGWRGIIAKDFTFASLEKVSLGLAAYLQEKYRAGAVVVGYDCRFLSEHFAETVAEILLKSGFDVYLPEKFVPTPYVAFAINKLKAIGGVMLTASHNPPEYNGFKFIPDYAGPALPDVTDRLEQLINAGAVPSLKEKGKKLTLNLESAYVDHLKKLTGLSYGQGTVVVDPMYGAGQGYLEKVLTDFGYTVSTIRNYRDPLFGGSMPEPKQKELKPLVEAIKNKKADLGLALDGDADRFGIVEGERLFTANEVLILTYHYLIESGRGGDVARTVPTTHLLDKMARANGFNVIETPVGFKYIGKALREGAVLGGEESGGLSIAGHVPEKDGILADLLAVKIREFFKKPLSEVLEDIYSRYGRSYTRRDDYRTTPEQKEEILKRLSSLKLTEIAGEKVLRESRVDGMKWELESGSFVLVRASGTEPVFRIYGEAESEEKLDLLLNEIKMVVLGTVL